MPYATEAPNQILLKKQRQTEGGSKNPPGEGEKISDKVWRFSPQDSAVYMFSPQCNVQST